MNHWPLVPLTEVLQLQRRWIKPHPTLTYQEIGIRSFGNGIFHKTPVEGSILGNKRVLRIVPGDLVFNNVFAWEGAVAVASPKESGMIGSHRFVTYTVNAERSTASFINLFFTTPPGLELLMKTSPGSAGRNKTLGLDKFVAQCIPLPPLEEQRRVVEWVDALRARIDEAKQLRERIRLEYQVLLPASISRLIEKLEYTGKLGDVLLGPPRNGWSARCDGLTTGTPILSLAAVTGFWYRSSQIKWTSEVTSPDSHYWLNPGDLLMSRSNTPDLVGHAAIYNGIPSPCIYPDLLMLLRLNKDVCNPRFVHYVLQSKAVRQFVKTHAKGTSPTMKKISQGVAMAIPFPTHCSLRRQVEFADHLDKIQASLKHVEVQQSESSKGLSAMLPAILDRAFRGDLG